MRLLVQIHTAVGVLRPLIDLEMEGEVVSMDGLEESGAWSRCTCGQWKVQLIQARKETLPFQASKFSLSPTDHKVAPEGIRTEHSNTGSAGLEQLARSEGWEQFQRQNFRRRTTGEEDSQAP